MREKQLLEPREPVMDRKPGTNSYPRRFEQNHRVARIRNTVEVEGEQKQRDKNQHESGQRQEQRW